MRKIVIVLLLASPAASAQDGSSRQPQVCQKETAYRALDFWVGDWDIYEDGKPAGRQRVSLQLDGCAVMAEWLGPVGDNGISHFAYDRNRKTWMQFWTTNQVPYRGGVIIRETDAQYSGNGVRFVSTASGHGKSRITLTPLDGGRARQVLELSEDGGKTWKVIFDAEHRKRKTGN